MIVTYGGGCDDDSDSGGCDDDSDRGGGGCYDDSDRGGCDDDSDRGGGCKISGCNRTPHCFLWVYRWLKLWNRTEELLVAIKNILQLTEHFPSPQLERLDTILYLVENLLFRCFE